VADDLDRAPVLARYEEQVLVQCYRADDWAVEPFKLKDLPPTEFYLCIQRAPGPDGRGEALHAQRSYQGPGALAVALKEALRKADANYRPEKTPDLTKPVDVPVPAQVVPSRLFLAGIGLLAILVFMLVWKRFG